MRMEELSDSRYIKSTDTVERYLLNLVQEYFKTSNIAATTSREYVIKRAVERMKEEISFDSIGVLSITLPDGEKRTGAVTVTLEDLNGESLISPKLTAFNVDFGTEAKTACEGNDPRLSDARKPLNHNHEVSDITGLSGIISTLTAKTERAESFLHKHSNPSLLEMLVYTGDKAEIDLTMLETLEDKVKKIAAEIEADIAKYESNVASKVTELNQTVTSVRQDIKMTSDTVTSLNKQYSTEAKEYADQQVSNVKTFIQSELDKLALKHELNSLKEILNNCYTRVGEKVEEAFTSVMKYESSEDYEYIGVIPISANIRVELENRNHTLENCQIEIMISLMQNGKKFYYPLPYVIYNNGVLDGSIYANVDYDNYVIRVYANVNRSDVPDELKDSDICYCVYSKHGTII